MTPPLAERGTPDYPRNTKGGQVKVRVEFTAPDAPPNVTILESAESELDEAVKKFVSRYRMPCMHPGTPIHAEQAFMFKPVDERRMAELAACVTKLPFARDKPNYPEGTNGGRVRIAAKFTGPDSPPKVFVLETSGNAKLDEAVVLYVSNNYRAPCMRPEDAPFDAEQDFAFISDSPTTFGTPLLAFEKEDKAFVACVTRVDKATQPAYPDHGILGSVFMEATFRAPDAEPEVALMSSASSQVLNDAAREFVRGYRMPCLNGRAVRAGQLFRFRGGTRPLETTLNAYLKLMGGGEHPPVELKPEAFGCPFEITLQYWEPVFRNQFSIRLTHAPPEPFFKWLASLRMSNPDGENLLLGERVYITVPCGKIGP
jgi:hypothetical protein